MSISNENKVCVTQYTIRNEEEKDFRSILIHYTDNGVINILLDTGANQSVWCGSLKSFKAAFPLAKRVPNTYGIISGFGGDEEPSEVWSIPKLVLQDLDVDKFIVIENLCVVLLQNRSIRYVDLVLSINVFVKCKLEIINYGEHPHINIYGDKHIKYKLDRKLCESGDHKGKYFIGRDDIVMAQIIKPKESALMTRYTCLNKFRENNKPDSKIVEYVIYDRKLHRSGKFTSEELKRMIKKDKMDFDNLTLTKDGRLISKGVQTWTS